MCEKHTVAQPERICVAILKNDTFIAQQKVNLYFMYGNWQNVNFTGEYNYILTCGLESA